MKKKLLMLCVLSFVAVFILAACNAKTPETPDSALSEITVGEIRVQLLSDSLVRIEVENEDGFEDRPSFTVTNRTDWDKVNYTLTERDGNKIISTQKYDVYVPSDAEGLSNIFITDKSGTELWRYQTLTDSNVYLPSPSDELSSWFFADSPRVIPSENGYSLPENGEYDELNGWDIQSARDLFVFLPGGDYRTFTSDFIKLTGRSEMVTLDLLGYWDSRWYAYSEETALRQIRDYKEKGYSIDVLVIDTDWRDTSNGVGYDINEELFPDMARFLEEAHKEGVSILFNDHPEPVSGSKNLLDEKEIEYRSEHLKLILALGLDYWWYDRNWSVALKPISKGISIYTSGMYAFQWITQEYYESIKDIDEYARRGLIMANVDGINNGVLTYAPELAAHRYTLQWTGDIGTDSYSLQQELYDLVYGGAELGLPYMSSDIGGHTSEVTDEMYVRWIQYGALSNFIRVHCTKPYSRMPWVYGETAEEVTKEYVGMRYRLLPLFYELAHENYTTGLPLMRRLDINYPEYAEASANDEYLLGDYILVAPITEYKNSFPVQASMLSHDGQSGLYAEYFDNDTLSGQPVATKTDATVDFDWGDDGPAEVGKADNFSVRWTGDITVEDKDICLCLYADDGVRMWIDDALVVDGWTVYDQRLYTGVLKAGTKHSVKIEYCEYGVKAHVNLTYTTDIDGSREVFIPDGEWIDVWSGERVVGPTVVTVSHPLETSPIYVRSGSVIALAEDMVNTKEKDWSNMTLDIYPSKNFSASTTVYEDDATTVAYKDGKYRTTKADMNYTDALTINIGAAQGDFEGEKAFEQRTFNLRIHAREDFGNVTNITVDGKTLEYSTFVRDENASPFAFSGSARDSDIYEFSIQTEVKKAYEIKVYFENATDDDVNASYDKTSVDFKVDVFDGVKFTDELTSQRCLDNILYGSGKLEGLNGLIGTITSDDKNMRFDDEVGEYGDRIIHGLISVRNFRMTLKTVEGKCKYIVYLSGKKSLSKVTVRDRAGNVQTVSFGDIKSNYSRTVTIECDSQTASTLYLEYSLLSGESISINSTHVIR